MSGEVVHLFAPSQEAAQGELFLREGASADLLLTPALISRALKSVQHATPEMLGAAERLKDELDLLCLPQPGPSALWHVMLHAWIQHHGQESL